MFHYDVPRDELVSPARTRRHERVATSSTRGSESQKHNINILT